MPLCSNCVAKSSCSRGGWITIFLLACRQDRRVLQQCISSLSDNIGMLYNVAKLSPGSAHEDSSDKIVKGTTRTLLFTLNKTLQWSRLVTWVESFRKWKHMSNIWHINTYRCLSCTHVHMSRTHVRHIDTCQTIDMCDMFYMCFQMRKLSSIKGASSLVNRLVD